MADSKYFDEIMKSNKVIENTSIPSGAMSYGEYVESTGGDPSAQLDQSVKKAEQNYRDSVKAAASEYDREIGTYGQKAENAARAGLMHAGYSDYVTGEAYASRQRSMDAARAVKQDSIDAAELAAQEANRANRQGYLGYIENYKTQKKSDISGAISTVIGSGLSGDAAKSYLSALGFSDDEQQQILGTTEGIVTEQKNKTTYADREAIFGKIVEKGLTGDKAISYAQWVGGLSEADAKALVALTDEQIASMKGEGVEGNRINALNAVISAGVSGDAAIAIIKQYGFDDATAAQIASAASGVTEKIKSENAATKKQGVLQNMIALGMTGDEAVEYAMEIGGLTEAEAETLAGLAQGYADRLAAEDSAGKLQTALNNALAMNLSPEAAKKYAELFGCDSESADGIADLIEQYRNDSKVEEKVNIVNVIGNIATLGLSDFEAVEFARLCGCDEDQVQSISAIADKLAEADADDAMRAALSDIVSLGYTGDKAKKYLSELHSSLSKKDIDTVLSLADDIYSTGTTENTGSVEPAIKLDGETYTEYKSLYDITAIADPMDRIYKICELAGIDLSGTSLEPVSGKTYSQSDINRAMAFAKEQLKGNQMYLAALEGGDAFVDYLENYFKGSYSQDDIDDLFARLAGDR